MSTPSPATPEDLLLRDLVGGLSLPGQNSTLSVGLVGSPAHAPQPPAHCLRACLGGQPDALAARGCPLLVAAHRNELAALAAGAVCPRGFRIAAQPTTLSGRPAALLTVEGRLAAGPAGVDLLAHLDAVARLFKGIDQVFQENVGFADEVLRNYEQLNLIFDVTQQVSQVTDVRLIERLLLQRIARLLGAQAIGVVTPDGAARTYETGPDAGKACADRPPVDLDQARPALEYVRRNRQVQVSVWDGQQLVAGPLVRLDDKVDVVLAVRPAARGTFTSGDMMIVESMLAFGGQIISNSELHERMRRMSLEVTRALVAAIDKKDHYTSGHSERVGFLTRLIGQELGRRPAELQVMEWAGLLHDIGKIGIPEEILCKPGRLTEAEFELVKQHPRMGYDILKPIASFELVLDGVLYHHEQPDGGGYPEGLRGTAVPLVARIIHVADTFDALTSNRSYRAAFSLERACEIIRADMGARTDAEAAAAFFRALAAYQRDAPEEFARMFGSAREVVHA